MNTSGGTDAFWDILGMITGAGQYVEAYPFLSKIVFTCGDLGTVTMSELLGVKHWAFIAFFAAGVISLFRWFERKGL